MAFCTPEKNGLLIAACVIALFATQGPALSPASAQTASLDGTSWNLRSFEGRIFSTPLVKRNVTLQFSGNRVNGFAGCNTYFGGARANGAQLNLGPISTTRISCGTRLNRSESQYLRALDATTSFQVRQSGNRLVLTIGNQGRMTFNRAGSQGSAGDSLAGTSWRLRSAEGPIFSSRVIKRNVTLDFTRNRVSGFSGCNTYFGGFTTNANQLDIGTLGATRILCGTNLAQSEIQFTRALSRATSFDIRRNGTRLVLDLGGQGKMTFNAA